jgi:YegS/Rv2252/BmrU family lipid kinase
MEVGNVQKRMMLLINPNAGKGGYKTSIGSVMDVFSAGGYLPTVYYTRAPGNATELVQQHAGEYDIVVCLGGDGTLSEVAAGMIKAPVKRQIGYIPLGTANDVARTLGLSNRPVKAAADIVNGHAVPFDIGQFGTDKFFTYVSAFGAFTEVSYGTPQETKRSLGHLAYVLEGLKSLSKLSHYRAVVEYDDGVLHDDFIFGAVMNSTSMAGMLKLKKDLVNLSDGMFEILLVKTPQDILEFNGIINSVLSSDFSSPEVLLLHSREVRIMFEEPVAWTRDGEDGGSHQDVTIVNRHPGIEIIV